MTCRIAQVTLDVADAPRMAEFWSAALGYEVRPDAGASIHLVAPNDARAPRIWLHPVDTPKQTKNRCHLDLDSADPTADIERLLGLGARRADVGQRGDEGFTVLQDPEGNEFCVLH